MTEQLSQEQPPQEQPPQDRPPQDRPPRGQLSRRQRRVSDLAAAVVVCLGVVLAFVLHPGANDRAYGQGNAVSAAEAGGKPVAAVTLSSAAPASLEIPAIDVHTGPIIQLGLQADGSLQVPGDAVTTGWYVRSPSPGRAGPAVFAAHVNYNHVPGVFARLADMQAGDEVTVHRQDGTGAVFVTEHVDRYPKSAFPSDRVYGDTAGPEIRLITCGGEFDRATRNYSDNVVVYAKLVRAFHN